MTVESVSRPDLLAFPNPNKPDPMSEVSRITGENKRLWNEAYASYITREKTWKAVALFSLGIATLCAFGMLVMGTQNKLVPYVVEVDKLGSAVGVARADIATRPDSRMIRAQLAHWIESVRSLYQDRGANRVNITSAYSMLRRNDAAYATLNGYFSGNDPFTRAETEGVSVAVSTVLPLSDNTWQVQWTENVHTVKGEPISSTPMQANLTVVIDPPSDETALMKNPAGVYITSFTWSQRL